MKNILDYTNINGEKIDINKKAKQHIKKIKNEKEQKVKSNQEENKFVK